jgi:hypothetical protein
MAGGPKIAPARLFAAKNPISRIGRNKTRSGMSSNSHLFEMFLLKILIATSLSPPFIAHMQIPSLRCGMTNLKR